MGLKFLYLSIVIVPITNRRSKKRRKLLRLMPNKERHDDVYKQESSSHQTKGDRKRTVQYRNDLKETGSKVISI